MEGTLVVDIDGTLCDIKAAGQSYADLVPRADMIARLREYQQRGYRILLFTARNMKTHNNNLGLINKHTAPLMLDWLSRWDIPYDEILFGKPWPRNKGFYIDDRAIRPDEFLKLSEQQIHQLLGQEDA
ncbi:capsular biosynthesis protein [Pseudoduganella sp. FT25W]|uniref:Capsular biosynthesis protein n=1 Tax=Duganella alba TaxID=2666081 RepID=A0A6L5QQE2_9BURK|nr:capsular biosynthesis protein [Duganella alba]MRX20025.1 capsular biosynthesis protein [Duganella alba]